MDRCARGGDHRPPRGMLPWVDARQRLTHLITEDAIAKGRQAECPYIAVCGQDILPASMIDPGIGDCQQCWRRITVPIQRRA
jgi:hypothetical protein